jgi:malate synthase
MSSSNLPQGVHFTLPPPQGTESIISTEAIEFLAVLHRTFNARRKELLDNRKKVQADLDSVSSPSYPQS